MSLYVMRTELLASLFWELVVESNYTHTWKINQRYRYDPHCRFYQYYICVSMWILINIRLERWVIWGVWWSLIVFFCLSTWNIWGKIHLENEWSQIPLLLRHRCILPIILVFVVCKKWQFFCSRNTPYSICSSAVV